VAPKKLLPRMYIKSPTLPWEGDMEEINGVGVGVEVGV
jgi:hypothetical protein